MTNETKIVTCSTCDYWMPVESGIVGTKVGLCKRYAPRPMVFPLGNVGQKPSVIVLDPPRGENDFCAEHSTYYAVSVVQETKEFKPFATQYLIDYFDNLGVSAQIDIVRSTQGGVQGRVTVPIEDSTHVQKEFIKELGRGMMTCLEEYFPEELIDVSIICESPNGAS